MAWCLIKHILLSLPFSYKQDILIRVTQDTNQIDLESNK
jgi:hypothetical protein